MDPEWNSDDTYGSASFNNNTITNTEKGFYLNQMKQDDEIKNNEFFQIPDSPSTTSVFLPSDFEYANHYNQLNTQGNFGIHVVDANGGIIEGNRFDGTNNDDTEIRNFGLVTTVKGGDQALFVHDENKVNCNAFGQLDIGYQSQYGDDLIEAANNRFAYQGIHQFSAWTMLHFPYMLQNFCDVQQTRLYWNSWDDFSTTAGHKHIFTNDNVLDYASYYYDLTAQSKYEPKSVMATTSISGSGLGNCSNTSILQATNCAPACVGPLCPESIDDMPPVQDRLSNNQKNIEKLEILLKEVSSGLDNSDKVINTPWNLKYFDFGETQNQEIDMNTIDALKRELYALESNQFSLINTILAKSDLNTEDYLTEKVSMIEEYTNSTRFKLWLYKYYTFNSDWEKAELAINEAVKLVDNSRKHLLSHNIAYTELLIRKTKLEVKKWLDFEEEELMVIESLLSLNTDIGHKMKSIIANEQNFNYMIPIETNPIIQELKKDESHIVSDKIELELFPNPVEEVLNVFNGMDKKLKIEILSLNGKVLKVLDINAFENLSIDTTTFPSGMLMCQFLDKNKLVHTEKLMKFD